MAGQRARYYDASLGSFLARNLISHDNLYMYADSSPIRGRDPYGLDTGKEVSAGQCSECKLKYNDETRQHLLRQRRDDEDLRCTVLLHQEMSPPGFVPLYSTRMLQITHAAVISASLANKWWGSVSISPKPSVLIRSYIGCNCNNVLDKCTPVHSHAVKQTARGSARWWSTTLSADVGAYITWAPAGDDLGYGRYEKGTFQSGMLATIGGEIGIGTEIAPYEVKLEFHKSSSRGLEWEVGPHVYHYGCEKNPVMFDDNNQLKSKSAALGTHH